MRISDWSSDVCSSDLADVIAGGSIPAGMEMMDRLAIEAAEAFVKVGYPLDVEALLIVELDGVGAECDHLIDEVTRIAEANGSTTLSASRDEADRPAYGEIGRASCRERGVQHG